MKIYTKTGDKGNTSLLGGTRVSKADDRIETYGTIDELNSHIGLVCALQTDTESKKKIIEIQDKLFTIASHLASDEKSNMSKVPNLVDKDVAFLEEEIDKMNQLLPEMKFFILPGGHRYVAHCHIARCVCRRAERLTIKLAQSIRVEPIIIQYLNRLSDYLFVLSRKMMLELGVDELRWNPNLK